MGSDSGAEQPEGFEFESYYDLLGVPEDASTEVIERAYREMAKEHHPDASEFPEPEAERRFRQLLTARDVLTSVERRRAYDDLGHEAYRRQSGVAAETAETGPEPRPEPGQAQRSARGVAHRQGDPVVTDAEAAFRGPPTRDETTEEPATGRGVYGLVTGADGASRSLEYVAGRWTRSWRNRTLVAGVGLAAAAGIEGGVAWRGLLVGLLVAVLYTAAGCARAATQLPRGLFLADRDHGRFSPTTARAYRRRGAVALVTSLALAGATARAGVDPWARAASPLRGERPTAVLADSGWAAALDVGLALAVGLGAALGATLVALGASIALWRGRYGRGLRVRPTIWEPPLVGAVGLVLAALAAGPVRLTAVPALSVVPDPVALAAGVDGTTVTPGTLATVGVLAALACVPLVAVRMRLDR